MTRADALARALEQIDAVPVAPGYHAYCIGSMTSWRVFRDSLLEGELNGGPATMVKLEAASRALPSWWSPERREVLHYARCGHYGPVGTTSCCGNHYAERVTASLETGEEIPA